jgi:hypothetical protein
MAGFVLVEENNCTMLNLPKKSLQEPIATEAEEPNDEGSTEKMKNLLPRT